MKKHQHLSFANVTSLLALFVALSGSAYAIGKNTVGTKQLKPNAVTSPKVKNASLLKEDFAPGQLPSSPAGAVSFFNLAACPSGWTELATAQGRYIVGAPAGGTLAGAVGTALTNLENRAVGRHSHSITDPGHTHNTTTFTGNTDSGSGNFDEASGYAATFMLPSDTSVTGIAVNDAGAVNGTNAPYIQLRVCQKG